MNCEVCKGKRYIVFEGEEWACQKCNNTSNKHLINVSLYEFEKLEKRIKLLEKQIKVIKNET